jgi:PPOX class probable F420-dependent enzyme
VIPDTLRETEYISLLTYRKNGDGVPTPVWVARVEEALYVFSQTDTGKVKRIRNFPQVKVAECTAGGKLKGAWYDAVAELVDDEAEKAVAYRALIDKYGWKMKVLNLGSTLSGKIKTRALIRLRFG